MKKIAIRRTTIDDRDAISDLLASSYPVLMRTGYSDDLLVKALPAMTKANATLLTSGTFYVGVSDVGSAVGCGGWTFERPGSGEIEEGLAHIRHFATHPDWTGNGIGRRLYEHCEINARVAGAKAFECFASLNAERFYAALGFLARERTNVSMGPDLNFPTVRMTRAI